MSEIRGAYIVGTQIALRITCRNKDGSLADSSPTPAVTIGKKTQTVLQESLGVYTALISTAGMQPGPLKVKIKTVTNITTIRSYFIAVLEVA